MTQLLRVESIHNAFNGILSYNICVTQLMFSSMQFNSICRYVLTCFLNYEHMTIFSNSYCITASKKF